MQLHIFKSMAFTGLALLGIFALLTNCSTSNVAQSSGEDKPRKDPGVEKNMVEPNRNNPTTYSWADLFRQVAGVSVNGSGNNLSIRIRGASSLNLSTEPLFILEGVPLGNNFASLSRATTPQDVKRIYVVKGPDAAIYGARGANGVIVVELLKFDDR